MSRHFTNPLKPLSTTKIILAILILGFLVFSNSLLNGFVQDDEAQILENPAIHSLANTFKFFKGSTFYNGGNLTGQYYRPIQSLTYAIVYTLVGANAFSFHLLQILIHICNTLLVFLILKHFLKKNFHFASHLFF